MIADDANVTDRAAARQARVGVHWWESVAAPVATSVVLSVVFVLRSVARGPGGVLFTLFDDAMISMRYARNFAQGHGLAWNIGQRPVEGYTNTLWTLIMALTHLLHLPDRFAALPIICVGIVLLAVEVVLVGRVAIGVAPNARRVPSWARWVVALYYPLMFWTLRGMETGLEAVLLTAAVLAALRVRTSPSARRAWYAGAILAAGVLTRDDIIIPALVVTVFVVVSAPTVARRVGLAISAPWVFAVACHTAFREVYYHALLPNTYYLKVSGIPTVTRLHRGTIALIEVGTAHLAVLLVLGAACFVVRGHRSELGIWLLAALVVAAATYTLVVGGDAWEWMLYSDRYLVPVIPLLVVLAALGAEALLTGVPTPTRRVTALVGSSLLVAAAMAISTQVVPGAYIQLPRVATLVAVRRALWLLPAIGTLLAVGVTPGKRHQGLLAVAFAAAALLACDGAAVSGWWSHNAAVQPGDVAWARYGIALRAATTPEVAIAVSSAGNIPYFDQRPSVDLLGKSDSYIAHLPPVYVDGYFLPGHSKRDLAFSVGRLRPAVVAELFLPTPSELAALPTWGYRSIGSLWFLPTAAGIRLSALRVAASIAR